VLIDTLAEDDQWFEAGVNAVLLVLCLGAVWLGHAVARN